MKKTLPFIQHQSFVFYLKSFVFFNLILPIFCCVFFNKNMYQIHAQEDTSGFFKPETQEILRFRPEETKEISIASNVVSDANKQPASITVITAQQLKYSGARTLSEALMLFVPGYFAVEDQDDLISGFRGLAPDNNSKVLFLMNGNSLNTEFFWGPPDALLNSPNMDYIERVEVIRGPGSVTLGQGALLGVINIVTKNGRSETTGSSTLSTSVGKDNFFSASLSFSLNIKGLKSYTNITGIDYYGQEMRREGWIAEQGNQGINGGKVADMGHRLRRTNNFSLISQLEYKNFTLDILKSTQKRDLYNFYRDREVFEQDILSVGLGYNFKITEHITNRSTITATQDNYFLSSLSGVNMGGTGENRYGFKSIFNINELIPNNRLAIGFEARMFEMGKKNSDGNNFIANKIGTFDALTANDKLTMSYQKNIQMWSIFAENFYSINKQVDIFGAVRFDNHPFWGNSISFRGGAIYTPNEKMFFRLSAQSGFRGAVGLHYSGGYRNDGFLRATNYSQVEGAGIPLNPSNPQLGNEKNINSIQPERITNLEFASNIKFSDKFSFNGTFFYSDIQNVIDVGVIYKDPNGFPMVNIGTDVPGDWNGYWHFKNTPGSFSQAGAEMGLSYTHPKFTIQVTQSIVRIITATKEQNSLAQSGSSMYLASSADSSLHHKAFPEAVTRLNFMSKFTEKFHFATNMIYYSKWYSPSGDKANGGLVINTGFGYDFTKNFQLNLNVKNITNNTNLYPMNSNAGGADVSPGTAGWENTTFWVTGILKL